MTNTGKITSSLYPEESAEKSESPRRKKATPMEIKLRLVNAEGSINMTEMEYSALNFTVNWLNPGTNRQSSAKVKNKILKRNKDVKVFGYIN